jgi:hypothetical protein
MKYMLKKFILNALTISALLAGVIQGNSQTTVTVNPNQPWIGYMNVFAINPDGTPNYGAYQFGSAWAIGDLRGVFTSTNYVTLSPCTNVWNPTDAYWVKPDGTANKWMDAAFYVENNNIAGQIVTFTGTFLSNSLTGNATCVAFIKDLVPNYSSSYSVTAPVVPGQPFSITLPTVLGDHVQWGFETQGPDVSPTNMIAGNAVVAADNTNVSALPFPSLALVEGQTASFHVTAFGSPTIGYHWAYSPDGYSYSDLTDGGNIFGSSSNTLTITNVSLANIGYYSVTVTNALSTFQEAATLGVQPASPQIKTNMLVDPGFESGVFASSSFAGWVGFNGAAFESLFVLEGSYGFTTTSYGPDSYNGVYQDRPVTPGAIYTGSAWFYQSSIDPLVGGNGCYLEVQFRDAGNGVLRQYKSDLITSSSPLDTWINLQPTNIYAGDFTTFLGTSPYMVAPPGSSYARFQITYHADQGGSVFQDVTDFRLRSPVATAAINGSNIEISFPTVYGPIYDVLYKDNLTDATWKKLTSVTGDGSVKTVTDTHGSKTRFYDVNTE